MKHELFYLVWREGGDNPTYKHQNKLSAESEAERLARNNPGHTFHVMACLSTVKKQDVLWTHADTIPF